MLLKVVYLDDEKDLCEIFELLFATPEIEITTFTTPEEAIKYINSNPVDIAFLDYRIPNTTGDHVALKLKPNLMKVILSGDLTIKTDFQFDHAFQKPFEIPIIRNFLNDLATNQAAIKKM
jgi:response regulator RpfG family c-di-GMP phosphodiesterase